MAAAAISNRPNKKSPYVGLDWSDLVEIWHSVSYRYKFKIFKIQHNGGRQFEKSKNCDISTAVEAISTNFGIMT